ncbi:hypothetical protein [Primorskyibacter sp. S87]|uniref:hypothetical protein n=1 Tax=Primorskyibacter sp. S87 TaxID=3415126 RepID=UPI003C7E6128
MPKFLVAVLLLGLFAGPRSLHAGYEEWRFILTPYVWAPSVDATLDIGPNPPVNGSKSLLDLLDGAFLIHGEARRGRWSILGEYNYLNLSDQYGNTPSGALSEWRLKGTMVSLAAAYSVQDTSAFRLEAVAGLRSWNLDLSTRVLGRTAEQNVDWIDPMLGLRVNAPVTGSVNLAGFVNVGGFGVGSQLQWEALAKLDWALSQTVKLSAGYRHLYLDFSEPNDNVDLTLSGPFVALGFSF